MSLQRSTRPDRPTRVESSDRSNVFVSISSALWSFMQWNLPLCVRSYTLYLPIFPDFSTRGGRGSGQNGRQRGQHNSRIICDRSLRIQQLLFCAYRKRGETKFDALVPQYACRSSMKSLGVRLLPARPLNPRFPVRCHGVRHRLPIRSLECTKPFLARPRPGDPRNTRDPSNHVEVVFARFRAADEPARGQQRRVHLEERTTSQCACDFAKNAA